MRKFIKTLPLKKVYISNNDSRFDDPVDNDLRVVLEEINRFVDTINSSDYVSPATRGEIEKIVHRINQSGLADKYATAFSGLTVIRSVVMGLREGKPTFLKAA